MSKKPSMFCINVDELPGLLALDLRLRSSSFTRLFSLPVTFLPFDIIKDELFDDLVVIGAEVLSFLTVALAKTKSEFP